MEIGGVSIMHKLLNEKVYTERALLPTYLFATGNTE